MSDFDTDPAPLDSKNPFTSVPIEISICVGKARPLIRDLVSLGEKSVLPLDRSVEDPVDLYVGDRLIARGVLEEQEGENEENNKAIPIKITKFLT